MVKRHMCQLCIYSFIPFGWVENGEIESGSFTLFGVVEKREDGKGVGGVFYPGPPKKSSQFGNKSRGELFLRSLIFFILSLSNEGTVNLFKLHIRLLRVDFHEVVFLK